MSRRTAIVFAVVAVLSLGALAVAAGTDHRATAFSLGVPDNQVVASVPPGQTLCQGPFRASSRFDAMQLWLNPARAFTVDIRTSPAGHVLEAQPVRTSPTLTGVQTIHLPDSRVRPGQSITACVRNSAGQALELEGGIPTGTSGTYTLAGRRSQNAIALLFLRADPPSLLSLVPTVFRRASLFKLSWTGAWTFWLLFVGVLAGFGIAGWAVVRAVQEDESDGSR